MKKYGVFNGWFKLSGHRGRLSFLFSSLIQYLLLAVVYYLFLFFGLASLFLIASSGSEPMISNSIYFFVIGIGLIFIIDLWIITCIEVQRLRDIGLNGFLIFIVIIISYCLWAYCILNFLSPELNWAFIGLILIGLFELFMPSKKDNEEINNNSKYDKNDNSDKKSTKRIEPTI